MIHIVKEVAFSLYRCIGNAINDCLDGGGCAEVCSAGMVVEPE